MKTYVLTREQRIPAPLDELFPFFADAANLAEITPPWLGFRIRTPLPIEMRTGAMIQYRIFLAGWPVRWLTRIEKWNPPHSFVDVQEKGPYAYWEHTHEFHPAGNSVWMTDTVRADRPALWGLASRSTRREQRLALVLDLRPAGGP